MKKVSTARKFATAVGRLIDDEPLEARHRDHALGGDYRDHRDCHLKPDLVMIYALPNQHTLTLVRLGSHAELFG